jgi:hypothetical protein
MGLAQNVTGNVRLQGKMYCGETVCLHLLNNRYELVRFVDIGLTIDVPEMVFTNITFCDL